MPYLLLIMEPRGQRRARGEEAGRELYARMLDYGEQLKARGLLLASNSLQPDEHATRVSLREGKRVLVDGPFSEAKEMVGGFFLVDCASKDQAIALASECPAAAWATVEVREVGPCYLA